MSLSQPPIRPYPPMSSRSSLDSKQLLQLTGPPLSPDLDYSHSSSRRVFSVARWRVFGCISAFGFLGILTFLWLVPLNGRVENFSLTSTARDTSTFKDVPGWPMPRATADCIVLQNGAITVGGYGDHLRLTHRAEFMAQILGCEHLPLEIYSANHGYTPSDLYARVKVKLTLRSMKSCNMNKFFHLTEIETDNGNCAPAVLRERDGCNVFTYTPTRNLYRADKLKCVADRIRARLIFDPRKGKNLACSRTGGYAALHFRWGDLAGNAQDYRTGDVTELQEAFHVIQAQYNFRSECLIVFAEKYPHAQIQGISQKHVVQNTSDVTAAVQEMSQAKVLFGGGSGFLLTVALMFKGDHIITTRGYTHLYEGLPAQTVKYTELESELPPNRLPPNSGGAK